MKRRWVKVAVAAVAVVVVAIVLVPFLVNADNFVPSLSSSYRARSVAESRSVTSASHSFSGSV